MYGLPRPCKATTCYMELQKLLSGRECSFHKDITKYFLQIFHIHCIKKWAKLAMTESSGWRCPGCQSVTNMMPKEYLCFCGKLKDPEWNRNEGLVPHSCGEVCGQALGLGVNCLHKCIDLCHPGPCPTCTAIIDTDCPCGKETRKLKCGEEFLCEGVCDKPLNCGIHNCPDSCHQGPCYDCHNALEQGRVVN